MAFGHVILKEFYVNTPSAYFINYAKRYTDMPMLVMLEEVNGHLTSGRFLRAADLVDNLGEENNPDWKTIAFNHDGNLTSPNGSIGYRWGEKGKWNLESKDSKGDIDLLLSLKDHTELTEVAFLTLAVHRTNMNTFNTPITVIFSCVMCQLKPLRLPTVNRQK